MEFDSKNQLSEYCTKEVSDLQLLIADLSDAIFSNNMELDFQIIFCSNTKYYSYPKGNTGTIRLCISVFPQKMIMKKAIEQSLCRKLFVNLGKYWKKNDKYYLNSRKNKEAIVRRFLNNILKQLKKYGVNKVLRKRITDVLNKIFCFDRSVNGTMKEYKSSLLFWVLLLTLLMLLLLRLLVPSGYHPSIR